MARGNFEDFINALGQRHSSNRYEAVNATNHLGRFQFGEAALIDIGMVRHDGNAFNNDFSGGWTGKYGIDSKEEFVASSEAQDNAIRDFLGKQVHFLRNFTQYDGQTINGHEISLSGMLGAAHLAGAGGVRRFLSSGGEHNPKDANGASLIENLDLFYNYEVPYAADHERNEAFIGSQGNDIIRGFGGNDRFEARGGNDRFDGGAGEDTIVLAGSRSDFVITAGPAADMWRVTRAHENGNGEWKELTQVEMAEFADGEIVDLRYLSRSALSQEPPVETDVLVALVPLDASAYVESSAMVATVGVREDDHQTEAPDV
jgi:Ca2+-binding RTX toxin-like protein